jgi:hypothetical protein
MNSKCSTLTSFFILFSAISSIAQVIIEKNNFDSGKVLDSDLILQRSIKKVDGSKTYKIFEIESTAIGNNDLNKWSMGGDFIKSWLSSEQDSASVNFEIELREAGKYYIGAWLLPFSDGKENADINVYLDDETKPCGFIKSQGAGWQAAVTGMNGEGKQFNAGIHVISFSCKGPVSPQIEFIRLAINAEEAIIDNSSYQAYCSNIREDEISRKLKSLIRLNEIKTVLPNPAGNYRQDINAAYNYTAFVIFTVSSPIAYTFTTICDDPDNDPVMYLFNYSYTTGVFPNPSTSWSDDNSGGGKQARITVNLTQSGLYCLLMRDKNDLQGFIDLRIDYYPEGSYPGTTYCYDLPVAGKTYNISSLSNTGILNYFTSKASGNTHLWLPGTTAISPIKAFNDDYDPTDAHDFEWGTNARVKGSFSPSIDYVLLSSTSSYSPTGTCDIYMGCMNSNIMPIFPNLKADDAIQSAPYSTVYNCISWTGGIVGYWEWPLSLTSDYCIERVDPYGKHYCDSLPSFDNFYNTFGYTRSGATQNNNTVDLWALNGIYTHGSVTKPGNNNPHGYDWESKPGIQMRTFHPRYSLESSSYGSVFKYYKRIGAKSGSVLAGKTLDELIADGLAVMENVQFTGDEEKTIVGLKQELNFSTISDFEAKYNEWKETWSKPEIAIYSDPRKYAENKEYRTFKSFCEIKGKPVWALIFEKYGQGEFFLINALEDLTFKENMNVLDAVKSENNSKLYSESGAYIVRSPYSNGMKYIKKLLACGNNTESQENGISYSNSIPFTIYPNPAKYNVSISFTLRDNSDVSLYIYDLTGKEISRLLTDDMLTAGNHDFSWNSANTKPGVYLVKLIVNGNINVQKLFVNK